MAKHMNSEVYGCLTEALRRFECFAVRQYGKSWTIDDLCIAWTGLGIPSTYKTAVNQGFMRSMNKVSPKVDNWWILTPKGAKVVLDWHNQGYSCENGYGLTRLPPDCFTDSD